MAELANFADSYTAAWCSQDPTRVAAHYSPTGQLCINGGAPAIGHAAITDAAESFMAAFPDLQVLLNRLSTDGEHPEYHWTLIGTHSATGNRVHITGYEIWTFGPDGLVAESQGHFDSALYARQLQHGVSGT